MILREGMQTGRQAGSNNFYRLQCGARHGESDVPGLGPRRGGVGAKVLRIVKAIFAAATGVDRLRKPDGTMTLSEPFDIARGVHPGAYDILARCIYRRTGPDFPDALPPKPRSCSWRGREYDHHVEVRVCG